MLKLTPAETDRQTKNYNYIEAISKLPTCFTSAELRPIVAKARIHFKNALRSTFVVLSDDFQSADAAQDQVADDDHAAEADGNDDGPLAPATAASRKRTRPESGLTRPDSQHAQF